MRWALTFTQVYPPPISPHILVVVTHHLIKQKPLAKEKLNYSPTQVSVLPWTVISLRMKGLFVFHVTQNSLFSIWVESFAVKICIRLMRYNWCWMYVTKTNQKINLVYTCINKIPRRIKTHDLYFTRPIIKALDLVIAWLSVWKVPILMQRGVLIQKVV